MGHRVEGFVARLDVLTTLATGMNAAHVIGLSQGFGLLLNTDEFFDALSPKPSAEPGEASNYPEFWKFSEGLSEFARRASLLIPIAYFETDYFGGAGSQAAAAWDKGTLAVPPRKAESVPVTPAFPINSALRYLGVRKGSEYDEFEAAGLHQHRSNESWIDPKR